MGRCREEGAGERGVGLDDALLHREMGEMNALMFYLHIFLLAAGIILLDRYRI